MYLLIGFIILICVLVSQLREKPLTGRLYRQPLALLLFSGYALFQFPAISPADWCILVLTLCLTFILGMVQGRYTPLTNRDGAWFLAGSLVSVLIWLLSIPLRFLLKWVSIHFLALTPQLNGSSAFVIYFVSIAGFLLGRYTMLLFRYPELVRSVGENEQKLKRLREAR